MPVFQMAPCLPATANWCSFSFVYVGIKIHVFCETCVLPSLSESFISIEYYWHHAFGLLFHISQLSHKYLIKSLTATFFIDFLLLPLNLKHFEVVAKRGTMATIEFTSGWSHVMVHYLSSNTDKLELLNTTRRDISCISALWKNVGYHLPPQMVW